MNGARKPLWIGGAVVAVLGVAGTLHTLEWAPWQHITEVKAKTRVTDELNHHKEVDVANQISMLQAIEHNQGAISTNQEALLRLGSKFDKQSDKLEKKIDVLNSHLLMMRNNPGVSP